MSPEIFNEPSSRPGLLISAGASAGRAGAGEPASARSSGSTTSLASLASSVRGR
jgi:hypothetical protein